MRNVNQKSRLDDIDINLLDRLQTDARITNVALAEAVNLSPAPCLRRVRDLESSGVIRGYVTLINPEDVGLEISAFIQVSPRSRSPAASGCSRIGCRTIPK